MLKSSGLVFVALAICLTAPAAPSPYQVGFLAGLTLPNVRTTPTVDTGPRRSPQFGVIFDWDFDEDFSFSSELDLNQSGFLSSGGDATQRITYLSLPLHLRAKIDFDKSIVPFLFLGPQLSYRLKAEMQTPLGTVDNKNDFKSLDVSLSGGLGIHFRLAPKLTLHLDTRGSYGLSNVNNLAGSTVVIHNWNFAFLAGLLFGT